jgi:eukaryotic-like serine/threonine-protein kinase
VDELEDALAERYRIERELGRGGMATVYIAHDLKHQRSVALKVLHPDLAEGVDLARFRREIEIVAHLQHPHILALHDSGEAAGLLYFVMPYVEGGSLRGWLKGDVQLPAVEAFRIASEVADALDYAHRHDVVHRDIKPENILLQDGHGIVADFGIARAVTRATGAEALTRTTVAIGTPLYMSPEQALGGRELDGRSDIYSLGCVLYEMLTGTPPFGGRSAQEVIGRRFTLTPPSVRSRQRQIPRHVDKAIAKAMALDPKDRFQTAGAFARALREPRAWPLPVSLPRRRAVYLSLAVLAAAAAFFGRHVVRFGRPQALDPDLVAVLPFRLGVTDSSLRFLSVGMVDLLATKLTGEAGPRAVNPGIVLSAWERVGGMKGNDLPMGEKLRLAQSVGAGQLVLGSIVGTPRRIEMSAELVALPGADVRATASARGSADAYGELVDSVAAELLSLRAGEGQQRLYLLKHIPIPALTSYLSAQASYRRGRYSAALKEYEAALDVDSTFAYAALGLVIASSTVRLANETLERGLRLAWKVRGRLSPRDRIYLAAQAGPHYPVVPTSAEQVEAWERAVQAMPDRAEAHFELGDRLFLFGGYLDLPDAQERAQKAFQRALSIDSSFVPPLQRLVELATLAGDTARAMRLQGLLLRTDSAAEGAAYVRWRTATARGDTAALRALRGNFASMSDVSARNIYTAAQLDGAELKDAESALRVLLDRANTADERAEFFAARYLLAMNQGRPRAAALDRLRAAGNRDYWTPMLQAQAVRDALFGAGDSTAARQAVAELTKTIGEITDPTPVDGAVLYIALCATEQWRLAHGETAAARTTISRLRALAPTIRPLRLGGTTTNVVGAEPLCPAILEAMLAGAESHPDSGAALDWLDAIMTRGPAELDAQIGNLVVARLRVKRGEPENALRALRRRPYTVLALFYLAESLREEGRLAASVGDREGAIRAYRHYLALRTNPEPALQPEVAEVRVALERLRMIAAAPVPSGGPSAARFDARGATWKGETIINEREAKRRTN